MSNYAYAETKEKIESFNKEIGETLFFFKGPNGNCRIEKYDN